MSLILHPSDAPFSYIHQIYLAHFDCRLYSHPIAEHIQEAARHDIKSKKYILCAMTRFQTSPPRHLSKRFVSNLLLSDVELSSRENSLQRVGFKLVTVDPLFKRMQNKKSQAPFVGIHACLLGKHFEIYSCQCETYEPVFCAGDLGKVDCGGDLLSQRIKDLLILSGVAIQSLV